MDADCSPLLALYFVHFQGTEHDPDVDADKNGQDDIENDFEDYDEIAANSAMLARLSRGWTAYVVAVVPARTD